MVPIEIRDILTYRFLSGVEAAPSGERAVFTVKQADEEKNEYTSDIYLYDSGAIRRLTADLKSGGALWEDDSHILFSAMRDDKDKERAKNGERFSVWYRMDINGGEAQRAFEIPVGAGSLRRFDDNLWFFTAPIDREAPDEYKMTGEERKELIAKRKENEDYHILTDTHYRYNGAGFCEGMGTALFTYDQASGNTTRITGAEVDVEFIQKCGEVIVYGVSEYKKTENFYTQVYSFDPKSGRVTQLYGGSDYGISGAFLLKDKLLVLATDYKKAGINQNRSVYILEKGSLTLLCEPDLSYGSSVGSDCRLGGGRPFRVFKDEVYFITTVGSDAQLRKLNSDGKISVVSNKTGSLDCFDITSKGTVIGVGMYDMALQELYEIKRSSVKALTSFNKQALEGKYVSRPVGLSVRSHGRRIDGWVLLPKDYDPNKTYPAVLDIHGGPKTVYGEVFYHEMQVWASKGYFVFFCNPTGSDGRGNTFMDIRGKYGTVDYDNIMDFTDEVLKTYPQIDKERIAVTGGSYGGFMTNWIITHTDRFACAATQRSISNWFSFYGVSDIGPYFASDQTGADIFKDQAKMWFHSPLKYADNAVTPTLFIHSDEDYRCPIDQGLQLYATLLAKGVDTRFVWFKGENHELSRSGKPKHRLKRLEEITGWIEKYTK